MGMAPMNLVSWKEAWHLVVVTQDGGLHFILPGWPPGCCFPMACRARSQVMMLVAVTQDGGLQFVLPGWPPGCCFPMACRARSQVMMLVEAWADSECSGDFNTVAINRRVDFLKKKLAHQCSGCALGDAGGGGRPCGGVRLLQELLLEV